MIWSSVVADELVELVSSAACKALGGIVACQL